MAVEPRGTKQAMNAVSCPSTALCVAVDSVGNALTTTNFATSGSWVADAVAGGVALNDVSCAPGTTFCAAVDATGNVWTTSDPRGASPTWTKTDIDGSTPLTGIACATSSLCVATDGSGNAIQSSHPTAGASAWTLQNVESNGALAGVACPTAQECAITGNDAAQSGSAFGSIIIGQAFPVLTTSAPTVTTTGASFAGTVNPEGTNVSSCVFQYSIDTSYSNSASCGSPGKGTSPVSVTGTASGLTPGQTYHYRLQATNAGGISTTTAGTFRTLQPPAVTASAPTVTTTGATFSGTVNPEGYTTTCVFQYSTDTSYSSSAPCTSSPGTGTSPVTVAASASGLTPGQTYNYRLQATNSGGTSTTTPGTFRTLQPPAVTASAPTVTTTTATFAGTVNPDGYAITNCEFDYGIDTSYGTSASCSAPGTGTSPVDVSAPASGLTPGQTYHYQLQATNSGGTTKTLDGTFRTLQPPAVSASAPTATTTGASFSGTVNPDGYTITNCQVDFGTDTSYGTSAPCSAPLPGSGTSPASVSAQLATMLTAGQTYHYRLEATNSGGTTFTADATFTPNAPAVTPAVPTALTLTSVTLNGAVNPRYSNVDECHFDYGTTSSYGSSVPCAPASPGAGNSAVGVSGDLSALVPNTTYHYRLEATNSFGAGDTPDATFTTQPGAPIAVARAATALAPAGATLNGSVNPDGSAVTSCQFEYGPTTSYGTTAPCSPATIPAGANGVDVSAPITGLEPDTVYHYRLDATNGVGPIQTGDLTLTTPPNGVPTSAGGARTVTSPPAVTPGAPHVESASEVTFAGSVVPNGLPTTVHFEYGLDPRYSYAGGPVVYDQTTPSQAVAADAAAHALGAQATGLVPNALYHVRLVATNADGAVSGPDQEFTTDRAGAPGPPTLGRTANVTPLSGLVLIRYPSGFSPARRGALATSPSLTKGKNFIPLTQARQLPVGTQIDARRGTLALVAAKPQSHGTQTARLGAAIFSFGQAASGRQKGLTTFTIREGLFPGAPSYQRCPAGRSATAFDLLRLAVIAKLSNNVLQTLHATDNHGHFRTRGRYSAGTVRGTDWSTTDRCDGTLTAVHRGTVDVLDFGLRKTVAVHAGHSYLAKPTRHAKKRTRR